MSDRRIMLRAFYHLVTTLLILGTDSGLVGPTT